jgi:hypothetical protein
MALRCGCYDQGDETVFGDLHQCTTYPALSIRKARPHRVLPEQTAMPGDRLPPLPEYVYPPDATRLYEHVLSDDCEPGDLG